MTKTHWTVVMKNLRGGKCIVSPFLYARREGRTFEMTPSWIFERRKDAIKARDFMWNPDWVKVVKCRVEIK